ncbi:transposable element Tcb2 transposase [Trichonephila clavipes]|nr:transposable element Tcb2 transposase [Trichonephila clavipes]
MTWTTPELALPLLTTAPHQWEDVSALDRFNVHRCPTQRVFSGTGLELVTKQATVRYLYHSSTAATGISGRCHRRIDHYHLSDIVVSVADCVAVGSGLFKKGKSYREIAKIVGRSHSWVQKIIGRFKSDGVIENKSGRGRKSILSDVAKRKVLKDIRIDPKLSAVKLAAETSPIMGRSVSAETVRNVIRHAVYSRLVARKKPFINLQNQKKRLEFAKTHQLKTDNFWKKVIFNDESNFNIFGSDGHRKQDNDPKHTAFNVKMCCLFPCKQQLHTPPQSPDINVINTLWLTLETAVQKHQIRNKAHLKQVLQEEWDKISPDTTKKLVESVPRRLEDIIKAKGHATKHRHCLCL